MLGRSGVTPSSSLAAESWDVSLNKLKPSFLTLDFDMMACKGVDSLVFVFLELGGRSSFPLA